MMISVRHTEDFDRGFFRNVEDGRWESCERNFLRSTTEFSDSWDFGSTTLLRVRLVYPFFLRETDGGKLCEINSWRSNSGTPGHLLLLFNKNWWYKNLNNIQISIVLFQYNRTIILIPIHIQTTKQRKKKNVIRI